MILILILLTNIWCIGLLYLVNKKVSKSHYSTVSNNKKVQRHHVAITKNSFASPLNPYEIYKDKSTNLYEPRKQHGGIKIEEGK